MAIARASFENVPINLVTAVPSIESYANIKNNKYSFSRLIKRYKEASLPSHEIIDLKKYKLSKQTWISSETVNVLRMKFVILYLVDLELKELRKR